MTRPAARLSVAFAAGVVGALANSLAVQLAGALRPGAAPELTPAWLYQRLVWGGLWGLLLLLPVLPGRPVARGLLISLAPSVARLAFFAPAAGAPAGALGVVLVFLFNAIWGIVAALWFRAAARHL
jgi:hypothetical protein